MIPELTYREKILLFGMNAIAVTTAITMYFIADMTSLTMSLVKEWNTASRYELTSSVADAQFIHFSSTLTVSLLIGIDIWIVVVPLIERANDRYRIIIEAKEPEEKE